MISGPARLAWIVPASAVGLLMLVVGSFSVANVLAREQETATTVFDEPEVQLIDVELHNGSLTLVGSPEATITVTAELTHGLHRAEQDVAVDGNRLVIRDTCQGPPFAAAFCGAEYTVRVPARLAAVVRSHNGSVLVSRIDGAVDAASGTGSIAVDRPVGDLRLRSSNGRVEATTVRSEEVEASSRNGQVSLAFAAPPEDVEATSTNGSGDIVLPDTDDAYRVEAASRHGSVDTPVRTDPSSPRTVVAESGNGSVTVRYPR